MFWIIPFIICVVVLTVSVIAIYSNYVSTYRGRAEFICWTLTALLAIGGGIESGRLMYQSIVDNAIEHYINEDWYIKSTIVRNGQVTFHYGLTSESSCL